MRIGIIVYSQTGNTLAVAQAIKEELSSNNKVDLQKIELVDKRLPRKEPFKLAVVPDVDNYDIIILGSFVEAFSLSPVMIKYLTQLSSLKNKKIICFVTQHFPYPWMGGNRSIDQIKKICEQKEAMVIETGIINWKNKKRLKMISNLVLKIKNIIDDSKNNS